MPCKCVFVYLRTSKARYRNDELFIMEKIKKINKGDRDELKSYFNAAMCSIRTSFNRGLKSRYSSGTLVEDLRKQDFLDIITELELFGKTFEDLN